MYQQIKNSSSTSVMLCSLFWSKIPQMPRCSNVCLDWMPSQNWRVKKSYGYFWVIHTRWLVNYCNLLLLFWYVRSMWWRPPPPRTIPEYYLITYLGGLWPAAAVTHLVQGVKNVCLSQSTCRAPNLKCDPLTYFYKAWVRQSSKVGHHSAREQM